MLDCGSSPGGSTLTELGKFSRAAVVGLICSVGLSAPVLAQFETRGSVPAPFGFSAAVGDFNRDGKLDFAVADNYVQVFLGNGDGTFQPPVNYLVGTTPNSVAAADLNRDGKLDLVVADQLGLSVLMGNGDGTFQLPMTLPTTCVPVFVSTGDFNGDHKLDLIVTYSSGDCPYISIFLGNGDGTFQQSPINTPPSYGTGAIAFGDFNRDGKLDLAVAEQFGTISQVEILLGNGDGTFTLGAAYKVGGSPDSVAVADFRGNGILDLAVASLAGGTEELLGNGDGTFKVASTSLTYGAIWVVAADLNGDGKPDLAVAQFGNPAPPGVAVILGDGDGTFQPPVYYPAGSEPSFVTAGDFNGDHKTDLIVSDYRHNEVITLLNTGVVSFSPITPVNFPFQLVGATSPPQTVTLTNRGKTALTISSMTPKGEFGMRSTCGRRVTPGANCAITITFSPNTLGEKWGTVSVVDSASTKPEVIELAGTGTVANISPLTLSFAQQSVGTKSAPQNVTLTNSGTTPLSVTRIDVDGANYPDFSETNNCPTSLNLNASCIIAVTFDPKKKGPRIARLYINDNGGGSPQTVPLTGTGN
jgi:hypothetical protein